MAADPYAALARQTEPADPAEAEYQAFCDALMDDERGRWFLAEFTRRNRNADTGLLLKALDRIEALVQLGSPDVFARLHQELRAILETIRASRAEAAADEIGETAKLLVLLAQIERRIDAMIGEPARVAATAPEIADTPQSEPRSHLAVVPSEPETAQPAEDTSALMPSIAWTEPSPATTATPESEVAATTQPVAEAPLADMQPSPPVNENEPQATYLTEPVARQPAVEDITEDEIARAIAEWTAASAAESTPAPGMEREPAPMAFGGAHDMSLEIDSAAEGFALPDVSAIESEPLPESAHALVKEAASAETVQISVAEIEPKIPAPAASAPPPTPHVFHAGERAVAPYQFEPLGEPTPAEAVAEQGPAHAEQTAAGETIIEPATAVESTAARTAIPAAAETPAPPPALDTIESRMAAANALAALAGLSEEERIALFT